MLVLELVVEVFVTVTCRRLLVNNFSFKLRRSKFKRGNRHTVTVTTSTELVELVVELLFVEVDVLFVKVELVVEAVIVSVFVTVTWRRFRLVLGFPST